MEIIELKKKIREVVELNDYPISLRIPDNGGRNDESYYNELTNDIIQVLLSNNILNTERKNEFGTLKSLTEEQIKNQIQVCELCVYSKDIYPVGACAVCTIITKENEYYVNKQIKL